MEITDLNLIADFEAQMKCLQNPSLIPKLSSIDKLPHFYSLWTFGALILAAFATFTNVFNTIKTILHKIRVKLLLSCRNSCPQQVFDDGDFDFDFSDDEDDDDDDTTSSVADSDDDEVDSNDGRVDEVFRYWGNNNNEVSDGDGGVGGGDRGVSGGDGGGGVSLRRRNAFRWSDFSAGKSVVKLWDGFGLGLDFDDDESEYGGEIPIWGVEMSSGRRWEVAAVAEDGGLTAEMGGGVAPAVYAAWRPPRRRMWVDGDGVAGDVVAGEKEV